MNFDRENNNLSSDQDFNLPQQSFYYSEYNRQSNDTERTDQIDALVSDNEVVDKNNSYTQSFEESEIINWQAQDIIIGEKTKTWFVVFFIISAILLAFSIWAKLWSFAALVVVSSIAVLVTRREKHSNIISYTLSTRGVYIQNMFMPYSDFKSFGILKENRVYSIVLIPKKRLSPSTTIYFSEDIGERITDIIGARLPMEDIKYDILDKIIKKINL